MSEGIHAGKRTIVTGGGSGIGRATAKLLASEGARVCVADLDLAGAESVAKEIQEAGGESFAFAMDTRDVEQNEAAVQATSDRFGGVDLVHLN